MKTNWFKRAAALSVVTAFAFSTQAADEITLKIGDKAPKLQTGKWVQGEPVKEFKKGTAYIVEFWATWCGPCRATIPHLNDLHKKFKDKNLVVIGQDVWENDEAKVAPFIKSMGEKMTYRVALDDKSSVEKGAMAKTWMEAAGQNGIPSAFIVNKEGVIAWIGHPAGLQEKTLDQILDGTFDIQKAAKAAAEEARREQEYTKLQRDFDTALQNKSWDDAEAKVNAMEKLSGDSDGLPMARARIAFARKDYKSAYKFFEQLGEKNKDNALLQNQLAWGIATRKDIPDADRDLKLAMKLAERGVAASDGKDANILDTLARVQFMSGQRDKAIATQEKAVELVESDRKKQFEKVLESYKAGQLPESD